MSTSRVESIARRIPAWSMRSGVVTQAGLGILTSLVFACIIGYLATPYMAVATLSYGLLMVGLLMRRQRTAHVALMSTAIAGDLGLVLLLELQRDAINTAVSFSLSPLQQAHIGVSTIATVLYIPTLYFGILRSRGALDGRGRARHLTFGLLAFLFRTLGFIFMFSLLGHHLHS